VLVVNPLILNEQILSSVGIWFFMMNESSFKINRTHGLAMAYLLCLSLGGAPILFAKQKIAIDPILASELGQSKPNEGIMMPNATGLPVTGQKVMTFPSVGDRIIRTSKLSSAGQRSEKASPKTWETGKQSGQAQLSTKLTEEGVKTPLLQLQAFARVQSLEIKGQQGEKAGEVSLINLNSFVNAWYLLKIKWPNQRNIDWYHLENSHHLNSKLILDPSYPGGIIIEAISGQRSQCDLWSADGGFRIKLAKFRKQPFADLCHGQVFLRNNIEGYRTTREWVVEFLRDRVWGGETITNIVKNTIYKDAFLIDGEKNSSNSAEESISESPTDHLMPTAAYMGESYQGRLMNALELGIEVEGAKDGSMTLGRWYLSVAQAGVYLSVMEAQAAHESLLSSFKKYVRDLDEVEAKALNYLIAFDLDQFDVNFAVGTEHPRVEWSDRIDDKYRDPALPGPDGIGDINPLVPTGLIPVHLSEHIVATFTGGFKRTHGAFKWGQLAKNNFGHHYGFMEYGVMLSRLQSQLATLVIYRDGVVDMKTWQENDNSRLNLMRHARQNGVPIIRWDEELKQGVPGELVSDWTLGNWSGSQDRKFRTLRAGMCLQTTASKKKYLIYGYFSSVTPTAMARVFQSYGCDYAMHLDMNALEHTYLALYAKDKTKDNTPSHLIKGMKVLDERFRGNVPRFIGYPDNRDFFYLTRSPTK